MLLKFMLVLGELVSVKIKGSIQVGYMQMLRVGNVMESNIMAANDGTGKVRTINGAVVMVATMSPYMYVLYVKKGVYEKNVLLDKNIWNVIIHRYGMYDMVVIGA